MAYGINLGGYTSGTPDVGWWNTPSMRSAGGATTGSPMAGSESAYTLGSETARSNLASSPYNVQLSDLVNATNRAAQQAANVGRIPGAANLEALSSQNIEAGLKGELDPTTLQMLQQGIAARGQAGGFGVDAPALSAAYQRAIGSDITALQQQAEQNLSAAYARNPAAPIYGMQEGLVTPATYAGTAQAQAALRQKALDDANKLAYDYYATNVAASRGGGGGGGYAPRVGRTAAVPSAAEYNSGATYPGYYTQADLFGTPAGYGQLTTGTAAEPATAPFTFPDVTGGLYPQLGTMPNYSFVAPDPMAGLGYDTGYENWLTDVGYYDEGSYA